VTTYVYDHAHRLTEVSSAVGSTRVTDHLYSLDAQGNRTALAEYVSGITTGSSDPFGYTYDGLERLTAGTTTNPESFTLDAASNISSRTGPSATNTYDTANRQTGDGTSTFSWNAADRLTARGSDTFGYDPLDRLTSSTVAGTARTNTYNGDGLVQSRTQSSVTTAFLWDPSSSPSRLLQVGADRIVYGLGPLYAVKAGGTTVAFARDGQKSIRAEVNGAGAVTASFRYRAYGAIAQSSGATAPSYLGYAGQLLDPAGLYYLRARWYDPVTGRFVTRDPMPGDSSAPPSLNAYSYAGASPLVTSDPSGLMFARNEAECSSQADGRCLGQSRGPMAPSPTPRLTLQGVQGSGSMSLLGAQGAVSFADVVRTNSGQAGATFTWGGGGTTAIGGANLAVGPVIANARTVGDYGGAFGDIGASCSAGLGLSIDVAFGRATDGTPIYVVAPQAVLVHEASRSLGFYRSRARFMVWQRKLKPQSGGRSDVWCDCRPRPLWFRIRGARTVAGTRSARVSEPLRAEDWRRNRPRRSGASLLA
jgi:RHS repeat-associated protein